MRSMGCALMLVAGLAVAGCGMPGRRDAGGAPPRSATAAPGGAAASRAGGALRLIDATGILALARDGRARATLVNVWATWCEPCREEFPELVEAANAHRADGVRLVLVSTDFDEQVPDVRHFLESHGVRDTS